MRKQQLKVKNDTDTVLGDVVDVRDEKGGVIPDDPRYTASKNIPTVAEERMTVRNPITGKQADIVLSRRGTSEEKLAMIMLAPDATREQKDSMLAQHLFERGKESGSFIAELFLSKGTFSKESQAFKRQMRFDFESFANTVVLLFRDISNDIRSGYASRKVNSEAILAKVAERLEKGADLIMNQRNDITEARMREKGFGVYINNDGKAYSIFEDEIEDAVRKDKENIDSEE